MLKAGCIGVGGICPVHLDYLKLRDDVEIVALCDIDKGRLQERQAQYGGRAFFDFQLMLEEVPLDAVWICTPPQVRREPLLACAGKGIPVLCEKPVERSLEKAGLIASELKDAGARVQIGYVFRSMPIVRSLREKMADDDISMVQSLYVCGISITRSMPAWFYDKKLSGGALIDQATHNIDLLRFVIGEISEVCGVASNPVHAKEGQYTIDEVVALSFVFENGAVGGHVHTWVGDDWRNEMVFSGRKRLYRLDLGNGALRIEAQGAKPEVIEEDQACMYHHQDAVFLDMVASGDWSDNPCTYDDGLKTLEVTLQSDRQLLSGRL
jgi:predicted dehydrogenase